MEKPLSGKLALVTGASRGIGAAIARRLAREGADIALHYGQAQAEAEGVAADCRTSGARVDVFAADLSDPAAAERLFADVLARMGTPDLLINNAGTGSFGPVAEVEAAEVMRMLTVNAVAPLLLAKAAARHMAAGGRIVAIGSVIVDMPVGLRAAYAASKGAVHAMTGVLAQELGPRGITVNAVAPGVTATDRFKSGDQSRAGEVIARTALGRIGEPDDIANVVAWLCGPDAAWVTGEVIGAHGGLRGL